MATQNRSNYRLFVNTLYGLQKVMGESRAKLQERANFNTTDLAAFDTLYAAVNAATAYFPDYVEQA